MTASITSCTADNINDTEDISAETVANDGDNGEVDPSEEDTGGGQ